ncbi:MAG: hypothetical protein PHF21_00835 [Bacilli bacterium]|nr:hypothetical protein [Bacilli bacterium]
MENRKDNEEPKILGTLKREKSSKPIFVFFVLSLVIGVTFALPYLEDYIKNPTTFIGKFYDKFKSPQEEDLNDIIVDKDSKHLLSDKTNIVYENIILTNVTLSGKQITYYLQTNSDKLEIDSNNYFLEIYGSTDMLKRIKLTGDLSNNETKNTFTFTDLSFNSGSNYYGRIQKLNAEEYPELILNSDESGIASIVCNNSNNNYKYIFENNQLKSIQHKYLYNDTSNIDLYLSEFQKYNKKTSIINNIKNGESITEETNSGFVYNVNLDLKVFNKENLLSAWNSNYYELNTLAKIIDYNLKTQGYLCK